MRFPLKFLCVLAASSQFHNLFGFAHTLPEWFSTASPLLHSSLNATLYRHKGTLLGNDASADGLEYYAFHLSRLGITFERYE